MSDPLAEIRAEIEKSLDWIQRETFMVDFATIGRGAGGLGVVVEHNTAMHALLFVRAKVIAAQVGGRP